MKNNHLPDPLVVAYIAARRTESALNRTRVLARQWRDQVGSASHEGDDLLAVEALQHAQRYVVRAANLSWLLDAQEAEVARLQYTFGPDE